MTQEEIKVMLDKHVKWVLGEDGCERADLRGANLCGANLCGANLRGANLGDAYLGDAYLRGADLRGANLIGANLIGANLGDAYLGGADLGDDPRWAIKLQIVPQVGAFTAFKRCGDWIVELEVTVDAKRLGGLTERKCRVSKALVKSITGREDKTKELVAVQSDYDKEFEYRVGEVVEVANFCDDVREVCAAGIHCYITREEAEDHI